MLSKLKDLREDHENGFTLIELLVVILIIGILASIAIPVFLNQRKTANDAAVESDVKNAATQVETWVANQKGADTPIDANAKAELVSVMKLSEGVTIDVNGSADSYCVLGQHENSKNYVAETPLAYDSEIGVLGKTGGACDDKTILPDNGGIGTGGGDGEIIIPEGSLSHSLPLWSAYYDMEGSFTITKKADGSISGQVVRSGDTKAVGIFEVWVKSYACSGVESAAEFPMSNYFGDSDDGDTISIIGFGGSHCDVTSIVLEGSGDGVLYTVEGNHNLAFK